MDKETVVASQFGNEWMLIIRLNTLYYALIDKGLLTDDDFTVAREKSIDDMYNNLIARQQGFVGRNQSQARPNQSPLRRTFPSPKIKKWVSSWVAR